MTIDKLTAKISGLEIQLIKVLHEIELTSSLPQRIETAKDHRLFLQKHVFHLEDIIEKLELKQTLKVKPNHE